ncbi:relaxase/mobilization nuclease domain-containing protein [Marinibaculum pumilum]|uniref:Relaxase/mobilization nuclease domain-containing protein n=1 Tax=Marinibaculum pumilum TaxID=1766165 RepID=A0ABV7L3B9_9PROT
MILVGNQRGGARNLAQHLLKEENERVQLHELRGFVADDLDGALGEAYATSRGTRCKQFLFSLSLNPPPEADVSDAAFERAINLAEERLGLSGQPRAVVFHEKYGDDGNLRRHAHAVWSRIDAEEMKAVQLSHSHRKLQDVSRELYLEHGWKMPQGLAVTGARDPRNFTLDEWQQARRAGNDPREIKAAFQDAWAISDSKAAFIHALEERGYRLARGDRRGFVAMDHEGEIYAVPKWAGVKTRDVRERLGEESALPALEEIRLAIARDMQRKMEEFQAEAGAREENQEQEAQHRQDILEARHQGQETALTEAQRLRTEDEEQERQGRFRKGLLGLWDRLRGAYKRTEEQNDLEADLARRRDEDERERLAALQREKEAEAARERELEKQRAEDLRRELEADAQRYRDMEAERREQRREEFMEQRRNDDQARRALQRDGPSLDR